MKTRWGQRCGWEVLRKIGTKIANNQKKRHNEERLGECNTHKAQERKRSSKKLLDKFEQMAKGRVMTKREQQKKKKTLFYSWRQNTVSCGEAWLPVHRERMLKQLKRKRYLKYPYLLADYRKHCLKPFVMLIRFLSRSCEDLGLQRLNMPPELLSKAKEK